ncbi:MAG TPA: hypothetical protein VHL14_07645 [Steroidobacteraceae bacterium]|jgi:hypothetical protein|nr:hypothetical protein [Steroidobacteraceae bacterium]
MMSKYIQDKSPQIFRPRVTPDPTMQSRLAEKLKEALERDHKFVGGHLVKTTLTHSKVGIS